MSARPSYRTFLPIVLLFVPVAGLTQRPAPKIEIREVRAIGCVRKATVGRCVLVVTLDGESTYSFIAAPKPAIGAVITIQGKTHEGEAVCREGMEVDITDWEPTGEQCAE